MSIFRWLKLRLCWTLVLCLVASTAAPALTAAAQASGPDAALWQQVCTAHGSYWVFTQESGEQDSTSKEQRGPNHCPACSIGDALEIGGPPGPLHLVTPSDGRRWSFTPTLQAHEERWWVQHPTCGPPTGDPSPYSA